MKVAIVHDYLNQLGGAERVVGTLHQMFPKAPIYTTILDRDRLWPSLKDADIRTSWMQRLPGLKRHFKKYLPLYPFAIESFDLREYDLVISSSSAFAKAAIIRPDAYHLCYCHTPMRFVWDYERYIEREQFGLQIRAILPWVIRWLRNWDLRTATRPSRFVANSSVVAERIRRYYEVDCDVLFPPVEVDRFASEAEDGDYFLVVSRLNPYKRIDLVVEAFNDLGLPLVIIGDGPDRAVLEGMAKPNVCFLGRLSDEEVNRYFASCRAFLFPGEEDFGITPLEANAAGRPVIAYRKGGALDTVIDGQTGVFFETQGLKEAVIRSTAIQWNKAALRRHAKTFSEAVFREKLLQLLERELPGKSFLVSEPAVRV